MPAKRLKPKLSQKLDKVQSGTHKGVNAEQFVDLNKMLPSQLGQGGLQMKKAVKILKAIGNWCLFLLTGKGEVATEAVGEGLVDYSGQGKDRFGR